MTENNWVAGIRAIEIRAIPDSEGSFEGRACVYGVVDTYGTMFVPGCFTRGGLDTSGTYALLWMHDLTRPVGTFTAEEREDGLYIVGTWDGNAAGQEARAAAASGSAADLSVGFTWMDDGTGIIKEAKLMEVSQVTRRFGAVPGSVLTAVRAAVEAQGMWLQDAPIAAADEIRAEDQGSPESEEAETQDGCDCSCGACSVDLSTEADDTPEETERALTPAQVALIARARIA